MTGGTVPTGLDGNGDAGAFPAPLGMVKTGSSEMETLQSHVCLQSCLCLLWHEVELECGLLALGAPGVKVEDSLEGGCKQK